MNVLQGPPESDLWTVVLVLALAGLALVAYSLRALDRTGSIVSFLLGLFIGLRGGLGWLLLLSLFTVIGVVVTRIGRRRKEQLRTVEPNDGERGVRNVLANGAAPGMAAAALFLVPQVPWEAVALAYATTVAAVTADTMASELGVLAARARRILPPFDRMRPGDNGGVSVVGQFAALTGAAVIAVVAVPLVGIPAVLLWVPVVAGFAGCQLDSVLGASLERDALHDRPLSKEDVNFLASAMPGLIVLVTAAMLL